MKRGQLPVTGTSCLDAGKHHTECSLPRFRVIDLGVVEGNDNMVHDINNSGSLVGAAANEQRTVQAFVCNGRRIALGTLGGAFSAAHAINNAGQIVGGSLTAAHVLTTCNKSCTLCARAG